MSEIPQICATCRHFRFYCGSPGYSDWTPGSSASIECLKNHWEIDMEDETEEGYRRKQLTALRCPDYALVELDLLPSE